MVRLLFIAQWQTTPYAGAPFLDAEMYDAWARTIQAGHWLGANAFYQSPLFPYVLALLYLLAGHSFLAVAVFNAVLGAGSCGLLAYAAHRAFGTRALLLTGLLASLYAPSIFYTCPVLKETLGLFLLSAFLVFFTLCMHAGRLRHFAMCGIFLGLAVLARGNAGLLFFALPILILRQKHDHAFKKCGIYLLGFVLTLLPVTLHNAYVSHDFVPLTYSSGFNFYIGNRVNANGGNAYPADIPTGNNEAAGTSAIAQNIKGRALQPSEVSGFWFNKGFDYINMHPLQAAGLWLRKAGLFLSDTEFSDNYNVDFFRRTFDTFLRWPVLPGFALVLGLSVFAYFASSHAQRRIMHPFLLLAALYMASVLLFYVTDRYRLPVILFLLPLAGATASLAFSRSARLGVAALIALSVYAGSALYPPKDPLYTMAGWLALGDMQLQRAGQDAQAAESLSRAIQMAPKIVESYWYIQAALAADRAGQHAKAAALIDAALSAHPEDAAMIHAHDPAGKR